MEEKNIVNKDFKYYMKKVWEFSITSFNGMALGLFSTLIIGTIIGTLFKESETWQNLATLLKTLTGVGIGIGIGFSLKLGGLRIIGAGIAGGIASNLLNTMLYAHPFGRPGDPMVQYFCVVFAILMVKLIDYLFSDIIKIKNPLEILIIPFVYAVSAYFLYLLINQPVASAMAAVGNFISWATIAQPFFMGIIIAVVMGMLLTAPVSSAAIALAISLGGIAGGAAVVGCSVQMLGFAVMSRKDNNIGTIISVGIGTSMLQFKNILKKPVIWLPTIIVSAILGPFATLLFKTETAPFGSGMGTSGLVGQLGTFDSMGYTSSAWLSVIVLQIILPIILVYIVDVIFRKKGLIKEGDLKI
ncbi:MAG: PTS sugar transporter subunit IIC [Bacilli bacterium]|nr:PTS sugar transporter subunit IIC [Bacilli bacterium]